MTKIKVIQKLRRAIEVERAASTDEERVDAQQRVDKLVGKIEQMLSNAVTITYAGGPAIPRNHGGVGFPPSAGVGAAAAASGITSNVVSSVQIDPGRDGIANDHTMRSILRERGRMLQ